MTDETDTPEIPETETPVCPWADAPKDVLFYEKIYPDGHLGSFTESAELAYSLGWLGNTISKDEVQISDVNGWTYRKEVCPMKTDEDKLAEAREQKHQQLRQHAG